MSARLELSAFRVIDVLPECLDEDGWHVLDLPCLDEAAGFQGLVPIEATFGFSLTTPERAAGRTPTVPANALVPVGRGSRPSLRPPRAANDDHPRGVKSARPSRRRALREAFFLALLLVTVAAAFWSGRQHAAETVIVVPAPLSFYSVVT